jgi:hypothetical protein
VFVALLVPLCTWVSGLSQEGAAAQAQAQALHKSNDPIPSRHAPL